jgi:hypothetical protein
MVPPGSLRKSTDVASTTTCSRPSSEARLSRDRGSPTWCGRVSLASSPGQPSSRRTASGSSYGMHFTQVTWRQDPPSGPEAVTHPNWIGALPPTLVRQSGRPAMVMSDAIGAKPGQVRDEPVCPAIDHDSADARADDGTSGQNIGFLALARSQKKADQHHRGNHQHHHNPATRSWRGSSLALLHEHT